MMVSNIRLCCFDDATGGIEKVDSWIVNYVPLQCLFLFGLLETRDYSRHTDLNFSNFATEKSHFKKQFRSENDSMNFSSILDKKFFSSSSPKVDNFRAATFSLESGFLNFSLFVVFYIYNTNFMRKLIFNDFLKTKN